MSRIITNTINQLEGKTVLKTKFNKATRGIDMVFTDGTSVTFHVGIDDKTFVLLNKEADGTCTVCNGRKVILDPNGKNPMMCLTCDGSGKQIKKN
jgi:DnaJ-class molecular chaperone